MGTTDTVGGQGYRKTEAFAGEDAPDFAVGVPQNLTLIRMHPWQRIHGQAGITQESLSKMEDCHRLSNIGGGFGLLLLDTGEKYKVYIIAV